jgi:hypothetical protein
MNAYTATLLNGAVLIVMSLWGFFANQNTPTALIPGAFGIIFLLMAPGVKANNKIIGHVIVVLVVLIIIALFRPLSAALERGSLLATFRVGAMMLTCIIASVYYVKSFIDARKAKAEGV